MANGKGEGSDRVTSSMSMRTYVSPGDTEDEGFLFQSPYYAKLTT